MVCFFYIASFFIPPQAEGFAGKTLSCYLCIFLMNRSFSAKQGHFLQSGKIEVHYFLKSTIYTIEDMFTGCM